MDSKFMVNNERRLVRMAAALLSPLAVLLVAAIPLMFEKREGILVLVLKPAFEAVAGWLRGLPDGSSFYYINGATRWNFFETAPDYLATSFLYITLAGMTGMALGMILGLALRGTAVRLANSVLGTLFAIPDFILALLLQFTVIVVLDTCGVKLARISHDAVSGRLLALPFLLMTLYPLAFSFRIALRKSMQAEREPFAIYALSKGLKRSTVRLRHVGAAIVPAISAELSTILGLMQANLFMTEYIFALPGITRFLFLVAFSGRRPGWIEKYQYPLAVAVLLGVMALYLVSWVCFRLALYGVRRVLTSER
jgi:ABC-type dipeptide/oligopeptide/nickel transport system permease component